jgi:hypothetical protein
MACCVWVYVTPSLTQASVYVYIYYNRWSPLRRRRRRRDVPRPLFSAIVINANKVVDDDVFPPVI